MVKWTLVRSRVMVSSENASQRAPAPTPGRIEHALENDQGLLAFIRKVDWGFCRDRDAVVTDIAALNGASSKVGIQVSVATVSRVCIGCELGHALRLDRFVSLQ